MAKGTNSLGIVVQPTRKKTGKAKPNLSRSERREFEVHAAAQRRAREESKRQAAIDAEKRRRQKIRRAAARGEVMK